MRRATVVLLWTLCACSGRQSRPVEVVEPDLPRVTEGDVARAIPATVKDREGWAADIMDALDELKLGRTPVAVCSVLAILEQESGYKANPEVAGLAALVQGRLDTYAQKLGPLGRPALRTLLEGKAPGHKETFEARLKKVRTEKDLDVIFRELLSYYEHKYPKAMAILDALGGVFTAQHLEDLNPITTAGSMQVSVRYATELGERRGLHGSQVRDALYTRKGGVFYGTARLLGYDAAYTDVAHRFADYNAGLYAARNAALQEQVREMTGFKIAADGDLLAYNRAGHPTDAVTNTVKALMAWRSKFAADLSDLAMRRDLKREKTQELEETETYKAIRRTYQRATGKAPAYARMPEVTISSPKMKQDRSTSWYARNVNIRYQGCLKRLKPRPPTS